MKTVVSNNEVPHLWAHQQQSEARNAGRSIYFEGRTIYSYGSHFPMATIHTGPDGENVYFVTTRSYSITTTGHLGRVRSAIPSNATVFHVSNPTSSPAEQMDAYRDAIKRREVSLVETTHPRARAKHLTLLEETVSAANAMAEYFGLTDRFTVRSDFDALKLELAEEQRLAELARVKAAKKAKAATKRAEAKWLKENAERIAQWRLGQLNHLYGHPKTILRIYDGVVETSRGAHFPIAHARRGLALVRSVIASGKPWKTNGHTCHLGAYRIDSIDVHGNVTAGCHYVEYAEIAQLAPELEAGPADVQASEGDIAI